MDSGGSHSCVQTVCGFGAGRAGTLKVARCSMSA